MSGLISSRGLASGVDNSDDFDRSDSGDITPKNPTDAIVAQKIKTDNLEVLNLSDEVVATIDVNGKLTAKSGEFSLGGGAIDQSVTDGDFTSVGSHIDTNTAGEYANLGSGVDLTSPTTTISLQTGTIFTGVVGNIIDNNDSTTLNLLNAGTARIDFGTAAAPTQYRERLGATIVMTSLQVWTSDSAGTGYTQVATIDTSGSTVNAWNTYNFTNTTPRRYMELRWQSRTMLHEIELNLQATATNANTFDTLIATGSGSYGSATFKAYDENDILITGSGNVNVAYSVDSGAFTSLVDQETFKAIGDIAFTTRLDVRLQLVGTQRFSRFTFSAGDAALKLDSDGTANFTASGVTYAKVGPNGMRPPTFTTAERDAISTPIAGSVIYNSTTNTHDVYNGTAWEVIGGSATAIKYAIALG